MKKIVIVLFVLIVNQLTQAQEINVSITKSEIFKDSKRHSQLKFSESDGEGGVILVRSFYGGLTKSLKGYYIEHFDKNLKLINSTVIDSDDGVVEEVSVKFGVINLVRYKKNKKEKTYDYKLFSSPIKDFSFKEENLVSLNKADIRTAFAVGLFPFVFSNFSYLDRNSFGEVTFSKNKNYMAISFDIKQKKHEAHRVYVFNDKFELEYVKDFALEIKDKYFEYENVDIDDATGTIYLLGKSFKNESRRKKKKGKINYHFELYKIGENSQERLTFETEEHYVSSMKIFYFNEKLICLGFYSDKRENRFKGVCRYDIDSKKFALEQKAFLPFSEQFMKDKYGKRKPKELSNISYRNVFFENGGDLIINAEEYYVTTHQTMGMNGAPGMVTYTYHYNDIVVLKITAKGKMLWARNINKKQSSSGDKVNYYSYTSTYLNKNNYFFINCSDKITKLSKDRIRFNEGRKYKSNLYCLKIDSEGSLTYKSILDDKQNKVPFMVMGGIVENKNMSDILFLGRKKTKKQLLKIKIK